jgi:hypothetical protein
MNHINSNILEPKPGPIGFIVGKGEYAAIPCGNQLMVIHNGQQIKVCRNQQSARNFIQKQMKSK